MSRGRAVGWRCPYLLKYRRGKQGNKAALQFAVQQCGAARKRVRHYCTVLVGFVARESTTPKDEKRLEKVILNPPEKRQNALSAVYITRNHILVSFLED